MLRTSLRFLLAIVIGAVALPVVGPAIAAAAPVVCSNGPTWTVADEAELNTAIACYNAATSAAEYRITFETDIEGTASYSTDVFQHVTQPIIQSGAGFSLVIDGAGHALTNSFVDTGFDHGLFVVRNAGDAQVKFANLIMGPSTEFGLLLDGGTVRIANSKVVDHFDGIMMSDGVLHVENSVIDDNVFGLTVNGGRAAIVNSIVQSSRLHAVVVQHADAELDIYATTIYSNEGNGVRVSEGSVGVNNSTIVGNGFGGFNLSGIYSSGGFVSVSNSTVIGNVLGPAMSTRGSGHIAVTSTIANECQGFVVNLGWNQGQCFSDVEVGGGPLLDNGCQVLAFDQCVRTIALAQRSPAIGAGRCDDTVIFDVEADTSRRGALLTDQRGEPRNPVCDSGAFETEAKPMCDGNLVTLFAHPGVPLVGTSGSDVILGTSGADSIDGAGGDDIICGGDGADRIVGGDGNDSIFGESGNDIIRGNTGDDYIDGAAGNDRLLGGTGADLILAGDGDDYIGGFGGADEISAGAGHDTVYGGFGADTIDGGPGNDTIRGLIGNDEIQGGDGDDKIFGDRGNDILRGGNGNDEILGGNARDSIDGEAGDDQLHGGKGDDTVRGGVGTDLCVGNAENVADVAGSDCEAEFGFP